MNDDILNNPENDGFVLRSCGDPSVDQAAVAFSALQKRLRAELRDAALGTAQTVADALARRDPRYPQLVLKYYDTGFERAWAAKANGHERFLPEFADDLADLLDAPAAELGHHLTRLPSNKVEVRRQHEGHTQSWITKVVFTAGTGSTR